MILKMIIFTSMFYIGLKMSIKTDSFWVELFFTIISAFGLLLLIGVK